TSPPSMRGRRIVGGRAAGKSGASIRPVLKRRRGTARERADRRPWGLLLEAVLRRLLRLPRGGIGALRGGLDPARGRLGATGGVLGPRRGLLAAAPALVIPTAGAAEQDDSCDGPSQRGCSHVRPPVPTCWSTRRTVVGAGFFRNPVDPGCVPSP